MILHGRMQTVQAQIRLFLEKQCDQGLHCLQFRLHFGRIILRQSNLDQILQ